MRILVFGSRTFTDSAAMERHLRAFEHLKDFTTITVIDGAAKGADSIAHAVAGKLGYGTRRFPADWSAHGRSAGAIRNQQMIDEGQPHFAIAFWDGKSPGTRDMKNRLLYLGIPLEVIYF